MILERPDPTQVVLQATAHNIDGTPKLTLLSATVRVYHVSGGTEISDLGVTALTQVGATSVWRYIWPPASLAVGQYFAEYSLTDTDGAMFVDAEEITVQDFSLQTDLEALQGDVTGVMADVELIRKVETGRWKIDQVTDTMTFYDDDGVTPFLTFNLKDIDGLPNHVNIFERDPV